MTDIDRVIAISFLSYAASWTTGWFFSVPVVLSVSSNCFSLNGGKHSNPIWTRPPPVPIFFYQPPNFFQLSKFGSFHWRIAQFNHLGLSSRLRAIIIHLEDSNRSQPFCSLPLILIDTYPSEGPEPRNSWKLRRSPLNSWREGSLSV